jgi:hypothetical protein
VENAAQNRVYVVWEQLSREIDGGSLVNRRSIWMAVGQGTGLGVSWGGPTRISPVDQTYAVLPWAELTADGNLHVTWTELLGPGQSRTDEQHVWYWSLSGGSAVQLSQGATHVNETFPSWVASSLAARGDTICAAWHGYVGIKGSSYESISFRCSFDAGHSWGSTIEATESSDRGAIFPASVIGDVGRLNLAWMEYTASEPVGLLSVDAAVDPLGAYFRVGFPPHFVFLPAVMRDR